MDRRPGHSDGRGGAARRQGSQRHHRPAGPAGGLLPRADLRPRQRLPEGLERRYRRQGQGGPGDRRDRGAGPRPAAAAGARRSRQPGGQREIVRGDADPPQIADPVSYTHLRAHETRHDLVCRLLLEKKKKKKHKIYYTLYIKEKKYTKKNIYKK